MVMGMHIARLVRMPIPSLFHAFVVVLSSSLMVVPSAGDQKEIENLLMFKNTLSNPSALYSWNASAPPCTGEASNWVGILCNEQGKVKGLQLDSMGLSGVVNVESLHELQDLRLPNLMKNNFEGRIPEIKKMNRLQTLFLSNNHFSGEIPDNKFGEMTWLRKVFLANNIFSGKIPSSLSTLPHLSILKMEGNEFSGPGPIPKSFSKMSATMFSGNRNLCEPPLIECDSRRRPLRPPPSSPPDSIMNSSAGLLIALIMRKRPSQTMEEESFVGQSYKPPPPSVEVKKKASVPTPAPHAKRGNFGASYKASIGPDQTVVVKNYKQMNHYRKEEKLLVTNFIVDANHSSTKLGLYWLTRLNIIKGVIKGLDYLYNELPTLVVPHGHLKSSNVLLDKNYEPLLCDYALRSLINQEQANTQMTAYKSPEFLENYLTTSYNSSVSLSTWVNKMVKEKKISEVFNKEMKGAKNSNGELISVMKIGLNCCKEDPEARPELNEVLKRIEELNEGDDNDSSSTIGEVKAVIYGQMKGDSSFDR
ncbi:hypothetical protein F3Y22_tig00110318pilonHSYRG00009 [Hibiscus syriacus]|uniref:Protein kinase domain-containing protein n=1 Tax=Hibiscus syriacus TaxID=106335 RepID=A0A6A3B1F3_HIBSY|nr:hypothetical protein F3Y22_tig00110318pilonHSYRG00009 [Hibiscus syriacus]